ncbi:MAG: NIPSNAP family protein [Bacteroidota bacterium]
MVAFDSMPSHSVPDLTKQKADRFFELRSYESYSEKKGLDKIRMFNKGGEVAIFEEIGTDPVFFAQAITGDERPNLLYMTTFADTTDHRKKWHAFRTHPTWLAIKGLPEYANTVSKGHTYYLHPAEFSQL